MYGFDEVANKMGIRILGVDRPGIGYSEYQRRRSILSWNDDIQMIADHMALGRFSVLGNSGGGPYALGCARAIGERLDKVILVSAMAPYSYSESVRGMAMMVPRQPKPLRTLMALGFKMGVTKMPHLLKRTLSGQMAQADYEYLSEPEKEVHLMNTLKENFRQGIRGYLYDATIYRNNWGFKVSDIQKEIHLWHGTSDRNVSIESAYRLAGQLPNCKSVFVDDEAHFSITGKYLRQILEPIRSEH